MASEKIILSLITDAANAQKDIDKVSDSTKDAKKEIEDVKRLTEEYTPKYDAIGESLVLKESEKRKQDTPMYTEEDEKRMDIIGQNGNDGIHYEEDPNPEDIPSIEKEPEVNKTISRGGRKGI